MPSINITDLNNAKLDSDTIAAVATSNAVTVTDRLGNSKYTLSGINAAMLASAAAAQASIGYLPPVAYAVGISLTLAAQTVSYSGQTYAPILSALPFTTSGTFETAKFRLIQGLAGSDLAASAGAGLVGFNPAFTYPASTAGATLKQLASGTNLFTAGTTTPTGDVVSQSYQNSSRTGQSIYSAIIPAGYNFASTVRVTADQQPGSTVQHMAGIDIYTYSACPQGPTPNERNMVALFTDGIVAVDNGKTWSINTAISDNTVNGLATLAGRVMIGWEADFQVNGASTVQGCAMFIQGAGTPAAANGFQLSKGNGTAQWTNGYITDDGAVSLNALAIGSSLATGANTPGQRCTFNYRDSANLARAMFLQSNNAAMNITSSELPDGFYFQTGSGNINLGVAGSTANSNINLLPSGAGQVKTTASIFASQGFQLPAFTVSTLPAPSTRRGVQLLVTDAGVIAYRSLAVGGGTNITNVTSDGNSWLFM